jgi:hypothetical protein
MSNALLIEASTPKAEGDFSLKEWPQRLAKHALELETLSLEPFRRFLLKN